MTLIEPPGPLLPRSILTLDGDVISHADSDVINAALSDFEGFDPKTCLPVIQRPGAPPHPMSTAAQYCTTILKEDGLRRFAAGSYRRQQAGSPVEFSAFDFVDATGAYSAYTFYRTLLKSDRIVAARQDKSADETTADGDNLLVWAGTSLLRVKGHVSKEELAAVMGALPKVSGRKGLAPLLPTYIPNEAGSVKVDPLSVRYALGPVGYGTMQGILPPDAIVWSKSAEAATASYAGRGGKGTLTLLLFPTSQVAGDEGRAIQKIVNDELAKAPGSFGTVKMRRIGPLVGMTSGALAAEQAEALVHALHLNDIVTFDKPMPLEFHAEVRKTATLLQSIAIFTGVGILAAIVLGIFLGGGRAAIRVMQGKTAYVDPEFLTIDLRDKPKALFAKKDRSKEETDV